MSALASVRECPLKAQSVGWHICAMTADQERGVREPFRRLTRREHEIVDMLLSVEPSQAPHAAACQQWGAGSASTSACTACSGTQLPSSSLADEPPLRQTTSTVSPGNSRPVPTASPALVSGAIVGNTCSTTKYRCVDGVSS